MNPCKILAVDDEIQNLESIKRVLHGKSDYQLLTTTRPAEALEIIRSQSVQIVITDQRMPHISGIELLKQAFEISPDTVRIILTAYTAVPEILDAINLGHIYGYITKPWNPQDLLAFVRRAREYYFLNIENKVLAEELQIKNEALRSKNRELSKFNDLKNRFLVVASHELRTPATIITGSLEILNSQKSGFNESQQRLLGNAMRGALRLNEIIDTFFESVQLDSKELILHLKPVNIGELFKLILDRTAGYITQRNLQVSREGETEIVIMGDQRQLYLVFENLLSNAIKYTPDGGRIRINTGIHGNKAKISVEDNGIGIPAEEIEKIFVTFHQLENINYHHTSQHAFMGGGTGLGLSLCRGIVQAHHGRIWAESEGPSRGATFFVTLPLYTSP